MDKYIRKLNEQINRQLQAWLGGTVAVPHAEVERFRRSIQGTAATLGQLRLSEAAAAAMGEAARADVRDWQPERLRGLLAGIAGLANAGAGRGHGVPSAGPAAPADRRGAMPLAVLLDDVTLFMYLKEQLERHGGVVIATTDPNKAVGYMHDLSPDCFIVDYRLPKTDGLQIIAAIRGLMRTKLFADEDRIRSAIDLGADAYVATPYAIDELQRRLLRLAGRREAG